MIKIKYYLLATLMLMCSIRVISQTEEERAHKILDKVLAQLQGYKSISVAFTYKLENNEEGVLDQYPGELLMKGDSYRLKIAEQEIYCDGKYQWIYIPASNEVQYNLVDSMNQFRNPLNLIDGYSEKFNVSYLHNRVINGRKYGEVILVPKGESAFDYYMIHVDLVKNEPYAFFLFDDSGNVFSYSIEQMLPNIVLKGNEFTFDVNKYPDVEVIDLR